MQGVTFKLQITISDALVRDGVNLTKSSHLKGLTEDLERLYSAHPGEIEILHDYATGPATNAMCERIQRGVHPGGIEGQ